MAAIPYEVSAPRTRSPGRAAAMRVVTMPVPQPRSSRVPVSGGSRPRTAAAAASARGTPPRVAS